MLCTTRVEWPWCSFAISAAGAVVVPIYPTNSPEECAWVAGNSESVAIFCEDASQVAKIEAVRDQLPSLRQIVVIDGEASGDDAITLDAAARARARDRISAELDERMAVGRQGGPVHVHLHVGHDGAAEGLRAQPRQLPGGARHGAWSAASSATAPMTLIYLFLPLAHAFGLLLMLISAELGVTIAYWGGDTTKIIPELSEVQPTYLPSVPRIFEKLYTLVTAAAPGRSWSRRRRASGCRYRELEMAGAEIPDELRSRLRRGRRAAVQARPGRVRRPAARGGDRRRADRARRSSSSSTRPACR